MKNNIDTTHDTTKVHAQHDPAASSASVVTPSPEREPDKLVPVSESIRYRRRAQSAEQAMEALQARVDELTRTLSENEQVIASLERRQRIDTLLSEADAVDLDVARLLTEAAVGQMDEPDVAAAVADLRRHKPYLFRQRRAAAQAMGPSPDDHGGSVLDHAAEQAVTSGDRRDLLRYLRLRRGE